MKRNCKKNFIMRRKISKELENMEIDSIYKDIIVEALLRRAKQYGFSNRRINQDITNLKANLRRITIVNGDIKDHELSLAVYDTKEKEILISTKCFEENPEIVFGIICHELYHVLYRNKEGIGSFDKKNALLIGYSEVYEELFVEKASYRTVNKTNRSYRGFNKNAFGYDDITFILDMIEATYGVNEQELLSNAIEGRMALTKFLAYRGNESYNEAEKFLEELEVGAALLFSTTYPKSYQDRIVIDDEYNIRNSLEALYNCCIDKILCRLELYRNKSYREAIEMKNEIACCATRLKNILSDRIVFFEKYGRYDLYIDVKRNVSLLSDELTQRLSDIEQIINEINGDNEGLILSLIENAQYGDYTDESFMLKVGIDRREKPCFNSSRQHEKKKSEPKWYCSEWDNSNVALMIINLIEKWKQKEKAINDKSKNPREARYIVTREDSPIMTCVMTSKEKKDYKKRLELLEMKSHTDSTLKEETEQHLDRE